MTKEGSGGSLTRSGQRSAVKTCDEPNIRAVLIPFQGQPRSDLDAEK
jgi:hypothetical protein